MKNYINQNDFLYIVINNLKIKKILLDGIKPFKRKRKY